MSILTVSKTEFIILQSRKLLPKRANCLTVNKLKDDILTISTPHYYFGKIQKPEPEIVYHLAGYIKEAFPMIMVGDIHAILSISSRELGSKVSKMDIDTFSTILPKYEAFVLKLILKMNEVANPQTVNP